MSAQRLEAFLAQLYVDDQARQRFLANPHEEAVNAGLSAPDCAALEQIDRVGLELAAGSFAKKRAGKIHSKPAGLLSRMRQRIGGS